MVAIRIKVWILPMPDYDKGGLSPGLCVIQVQYRQGGNVFTNTNQGKGFTLQEAEAIKSKYHER